MKPIMITLMYLTFGGDIKLDTFEDTRGEIWTIYSGEHTDLSFVADKVTISKFGVLRGFHGDPYTAKLITCLSGRFQLAIADLRKDSETYGNTETCVITDKEPTVVIVPAGCVNAHLCLSNTRFSNLCLQPLQNL